MKLIFIFSCFVLSIRCENIRVKRIVGGEKAAIPKPIELPTNKKIDKTSSSSSSSSNSIPTGSEKVNTDETVFIYEEERNSEIIGTKGKNSFVSFLGIRYAKPPIDKNRFQRPILSPLKGVIKAVNYGSPCKQLSADGSSIVGNEDCLFLNIYSPSVHVNNATGYPVFFWIHGGGFTTGSGNQYGVSELVKKNIVVVTINYRLGTLGFFGSKNQQMSGNAGLFDVRAAFEWTRRYIIYFGGNPNKIIVAGQGNGASIAILLSQSDFTSGYIQGVFAMSGTGISSTAVDYEPINTSNFIATSTNCTSLNLLETVRCLQNSPLNNIFNTDKELQNNRIGDGGFVNAVSLLQSAAPVVEGPNDGRYLSNFLNFNPLDALKKKKISKVPLLTGTMKTETGKVATGKFKEDVMNRLKIPDFLTKTLPQKLVKNNVGVFIGNISSELINFLFGNDKYLELISLVSKVVSPFEKVIESTTDALFNLPAFTTLNLWSNSGGNSYMYSFEYESAKPSGKSFLDGTIFSSGSTTSNVSASHGDDLKYLFELQTLEGKPVTESVLTDVKDKKMKTMFISAVAEFIYNGKPKISELSGDWPLFGTDQSYAVISENPKYEKNFRYCQMAVWGGLFENLLNPICNLPGIADIKNLVPSKLLEGSIFNPNDISKVLTNVISVNGPSIGNGNILTRPNINKIIPESRELIKTDTNSKQTTKIPLGGLSVKIPAFG